MLSKGEIIAALVALGFEGDIGPSGGEDPDLDGHDVILYSQMPQCGYQFNDDGSVQSFFPDEEAMYNSLIQDCGFTEEEAKEIIMNPPFYPSVIDLFRGEDGWFMYFETDHPKITEAIKAVLAI